MGIKISFENFVEKSKKIHGDVYEYIDYNGIDTKTTIKCKLHGEFLQTPYSHMKGQGCPKCAAIRRSEKLSMGLLVFINKSNIVHKNKYDYSESVYKNSKTNIKIKCIKHGIFLQRPEVHINGFGCPKCSGLSRMNTELFIKKAKVIHNNQYDYSLTVYKNSRSKVKIICKIHGEFEQEANSHINGSNVKCKKGRGCPNCLYKGQAETGNILKKILPGIDIKSQYFILYKNTRLLADFYFEVNGAKYIVEYNGLQHYEPVNFNGMNKNEAINNFNNQKIRDRLKNNYCKENNIIKIDVDSRIVSFDKIESYLTSMISFDKKDCYENN